MYGASSYHFMLLLLLYGLQQVSHIDQISTCYTHILYNIIFYILARRIRIGILCVPTLFHTGDVYYNVILCALYTHRPVVYNIYKCVYLSMLTRRRKIDGK